MKERERERERERAGGGDNFREDIRGCLMRFRQPTDSAIPGERERERDSVQYCIIHVELIFSIVQRFLTGV